ncbi:MAG: hypothetical protein ACXW1U_14490 [Methylobacter sp.]
MATLKQMEHKAKKAVEVWNSQYNVGQPVKLLKDGGDIVETVTTSEAAIICNQAVIWLKDISGCYALDRCTVI